MNLTGSNIEKNVLMHQESIIKLSIMNDVVLNDAMTKVNIEALGMMLE